jgi:hypothetical protein
MNWQLNQKPFLSTKPRQESAAMNNNHKPHPASKEQLNKLTNRSSSKQRTFAKQAAKAPEPVERQHLFFKKRINPYQMYI